MPQYAAAILRFSAAGQYGRRSAKSVIIPILFPIRCEASDGIYRLLFLIRVDCHDQLSQIDLNY